MSLVCALLSSFTLAVFARIILDWFRVPSDHPVGQIRRYLGIVVDPVLTPLRQVLPSIPMGNARLDLSPIVLIIGLQILSRIIGCG